MDLYSRKIVGWSMRDDLEAPLVVDAISMAIARRRPSRAWCITLIAARNTPRSRWAVRCATRRSTASMGSKGDPCDNACAESCISTIKNELVKRRTFVTRDQARLALFRYIESFYNPLRRHSSIDMLSPSDYEHRYWQAKTAAAVA